MFNTFMVIKIAECDAESPQYVLIPQRYIHMLVMLFGYITRLGVVNARFRQAAVSLTP